MTTALVLHCLQPTRKHGPRGPSTGWLTVSGPSHLGHARFADGAPSMSRIICTSVREYRFGVSLDSDMIRPSQLKSSRYLWRAQGSTKIRNGRYLAEMTFLEHQRDERMPTEPDRHEIRIEVKESDIDMMGHVNNVVFLRWVQEAATAHWFTAASPTDQEALLWVVLRHEIDYKHPALLEDEIVAQTWVGTASRRAFERHTELSRASDGRLLARARTLWCPIDAKTGKPTDVSADVRARFSVA